MLFKLGEFVTSHAIDGTTFYLKGLTVGQYDDLMCRGLIGGRMQNPSTLILVALTGVVGWDNLLDTETLENIEFSRDILEVLPEEVMRELGSIILNDLTMVPKDITEKLRGHIRFAYWLGEEKNKATAEYYDCSKCIKAKKYATRPCGLSKEEREMIAGKDEDEQKKVAEEIARNKALQKQLKRIKTKKLTMNPPKVIKPIDSGRGIKINSFDFPECPITWVDTWISTLADHMLHCDRSGITYFSGGLSDQPMKLYGIKKIVSSEVNKIEAERMKKD